MNNISMMTLYAGVWKPGRTTMRQNDGWVQEADIFGTQVNLCSFFPDSIITF